jgi:hypothetical protein
VSAWWGVHRCVALALEAEFVIRALITVPLVAADVGVVIRGAAMEKMAGILVSRGRTEPKTQIRLNLLHPTLRKVAQPEVRSRLGGMVDDQLEAPRRLP